MATTRKTKTTVTKSVPITQDNIEENIDDMVVKNTTEKIVPKEIDIHQYIPVISGVHGKLTYISKKTGEKFSWLDFGEEQDMELQELRNAKGSNKKFFEKNWFMFNDEYDWVIDYLGVRNFYKHALKIDQFDELFEKSPSEITKIIKDLSNGQKRAVGYRARQLISENAIDSLKVIDALEKSLGIELIER